MLGAKRYGQNKNKNLQKNVCQNLDQNVSKIRKKWPFFVIGVSVETAEYSVPNIRLVLAEYSVFGRTLKGIDLLIIDSNCF